MFYGADDYSVNNLLEDIKNDTTLLAYELEGKPMPKEHGPWELLFLTCMLGKDLDFWTK